MTKKLSALFALSVLSLTGCGQPSGSHQPVSESEPSAEVSSAAASKSSEETKSSGGGSSSSTSTGPTKVTVAKHTLSDGNPPIDIHSVGQHVDKTTWDSFKGAPASKFNSHYNYTYRYFVGGQVTYETFTKDGYELSNNTGTYYYERIGGKRYQYNSMSDGYERVSSSYDFIARRSEAIAHEADVHMFAYEEYTYFGEDDGMDGVFIYNTSAFSTEIKFQGGYLTYLRYTLNSPLTTYEIQLAFETTIEIPKSYYYQD